MRQSKIHCTIRADDPWLLFGELEAARLSGPGSDVRTPEGIILSVVVGADELTRAPMVAAARQNEAIYAARPELRERYYFRPVQKPQQGRARRVRWLWTRSHEHLNPVQRRAATRARERAEREQEVAA